MPGPRPLARFAALLGGALAAATWLRRRRRPEPRPLPAPAAPPPALTRPPAERPERPEPEPAAEPVDIVTVVDDLLERP